MEGSTVNLDAMITAIRERADKMRCRPLTVFVSSTFLDLRRERHVGNSLKGIKDSRVVPT